MFNIGPGELLAICAVALIVLGPDRLPQALRTVGRVVGELRRISGGFQEEIRRAVEDSEREEMERTLREAVPSLPETSSPDPAVADDEIIAEADATDDADADDLDAAAEAHLDIGPASEPQDPDAGALEPPEADGRAAS